MRFSTYILLLNSFFLSCDGLAFLPEETSDHFANAPFITVTSPKGGEAWGMGTAQTITWSFNNLGEASNPYPSSFTIDLYRNSEFINNIATVSDGYHHYPDEKLGEGSYNWMIPISLSDSNSYKIRISSFDSAENLVFGEIHFLSLRSEIYRLRSSKLAIDHKICTNLGVERPKMSFIKKYDFPVCNRLF